MEDMLDKVGLAVEAFQKIHSNEEITEEQMQIMKDLICGNTLFSNVLMDDKCFWTLINSDLEHFHENYNAVLTVFIKKSYCWSYGLRYDQLPQDDTTI